MTVKLNRWGYLFRRFTKISIVFWLCFAAYSIHDFVMDPNSDIRGLILLWVLVIVIQKGSALYLAITSFQVREGQIEYYDKIDVVPGKGTRYEKMCFLLRDVKSIKIKQGIFEKLFGFSHIEIEGESEAASSFDTYRIPKRKKHFFYGVRNPGELYDDLCRFFPNGVVEDNTTWR